MKRKFFNQIEGVTLVVFLCLILLSFASCSGDDDDDEDGTTSSATTYVNGYAAVDLGLSVKWATCNIGADSPEEYGNYYAWGETETKWNFPSSKSVTYGVDMDDISGNAEYDAAMANWGSSWRMPTYDEMEELVNSCTWEWKKRNYIYGYLVTGSTGNSIFLPAAGYRVGEHSSYEGNKGSYWSSTPNSSDTVRAYYLHFYINIQKVSDQGYRHYGRTLRPVTD